MDTSANEVNETKEAMRQYEFDFPKYAAFVLLLGPRGTGKGVLADHLIKEMNKVYKWKYAFCFSSTSKYQGSFSCIHKAYHYSDLSMLPRIIEIQEEQTKCPILIVFDDLGGLRSPDGKLFRNSNELMDLAVRGRHLGGPSGTDGGITTIVLAQRHNLISPTIRSNSDVIFSFMPRSITDRKILVDNFMSMKRNLKEANGIFDKVYEKPYNALVISPFRNGINSVWDYLNEIVADPNVGKYHIGNWFDFKTEQAEKEEAEEGEEKNNRILLHIDGF